MGRRKSRTKTKVKTEINVDNLVAMAVSTGKTKLGIRTAIKESKRGENAAAAFIVAANCPEELTVSLRHNVSFSDVPIITYPKSSVELGYAIGRPHRVAVITVYDPGNSKLIDVMTGKQPIEEDA